MYSVFMLANASPVVQWSSCGIESTINHRQLLASLLLHTWSLNICGAIVYTSNALCDQWSLKY